MKLLIGIDGGGTHSTAVAVRPDGSVAALTSGGGLNFHNTGVEPVRLRMEEMTVELCRQAGVAVADSVICAGMSALDLPADETTTLLFADGILRYDQLDLQSDAYAALMGCTLGKPGIIVICGTGSMMVLLDSQGRQIPGGGWGYLLGDACSSYTLAREGLIAAIDAAEGIRPPTPLTADALTFFGVRQLRAIIDHVYSPDFGPEKLAAFARCVLTRAGEGERTALDIVRQNVIRLAQLTARTLDKDPAAQRIGLYGGVFAHNSFVREMFINEVTTLAPSAVFCPVAFPPELGAVIHLFRQRGLLTPDVLERMKNTSKEIYPS